MKRAIVLAALLSVLAAMSFPTEAAGPGTKTHTHSRSPSVGA